MALIVGDKVGIESTERVRKLRVKMLRAPEVCVERGYWLTESYKETESEPQVIRRAKALKKVLENITISIEDDELLVGKVTSKVRGCPVMPEFNWQWILEEIDTISTRDWDRVMPLTEEDKTKMREFLPYWKGKAVYDKLGGIAPENLLKIKNMVITPGGYSPVTEHFGHNSIDYELVMADGLKGMGKRIDEELAKLNLGHIQDLQKHQFLTAATITLNAARDFANRYAQLARSMAQKETNSQRKAELERIAETCAWVPENPPRSFYEALQSTWFTYTILLIEGLGYGVGMGRPDQYLYPFYKKDVEDGKLTKEKARELIALLYIKMNGTVLLQGSETVRFMGGFVVQPSMAVGGITRDGKDAVNELSYLFLDASIDAGLSAEDITVRIHKNNPDAFVIKACEVARLLRGKLKFVSDETIIQQLLSDGKPIEYARDYIIVSCGTPSVPGYSHDIAGGMANYPLMLELALNNGVSRLTGEPIGAKTGDPRMFASYDEVWAAFKQQVEALLPIFFLYVGNDRRLYGELVQVPFQSTFCHGCIEKGIDITAGGTAPYMTESMLIAGLANVADSLAAIKKAVFEDKKITMQSLIDALDKNFEDEEEILNILKDCPKYGNDVDYVDLIANEVVAHAYDLVAKYRGPYGAIWNIGAILATANIPMGYQVGALPDGRRAGEPLAEGGLSPYQGRNVSGPTATIRSVTKLDQVKMSGGNALNMRFNPEVLKGEAKMRKFVSLLRTYCETGGSLIQFNIVSTDMLLDAQKHPEKHRDLLVRVATYSAYFVELSKELQDNIIARLEFEEV